MRALMFQGTGSDVGKSFIVAGLCRALSNRQVRVMPFKPQNMSNNAAVTQGGGEIGRAQALQALACRVEPTVDMNPVLLKPQGDTEAQVIVRGHMRGTLQANRFNDDKIGLLSTIIESFQRLRKAADIVLVEGAGSPAETNLRTNDIANMGFAMAQGIPVVLIADIDRGGVIANLVGTKEVLSAEDNGMIAGFIINKFRGDIALFDQGLADIVTRTGWQSYGVLPFLAEAVRLPAEDAVVLEQQGRAGRGNINIVVPMLSRIANFDDLDPLKAEPDVSVTMVPPGSPLPGDADVVIVPGTKSTILDLEFFRAQGWDIDLLAHVRRGGRVLGLCGGYQILGKSVGDPGGIEGRQRDCLGIGLLDVDTILTEDKQLTRVSGVCVNSGHPVEGYEIHIGKTEGPDREHPFLRLNVDGRVRELGAISKNGQVAGCYLHGLFTADAFRHWWLSGIRPRSASGILFSREVDAALDAIAQHLETHLDIDAMLALAR